MKKLDVELDHLRTKLAEAEETLRAIRSGDVDALVVEGPAGSRVFTLMGADAGYRTMVEQMQEGAITVDRAGSILYCNRRFAEMLRMPHADVLGTSLAQFLPDERPGPLTVLLDTARGGSRRETLLQGVDGVSIPVQITASPMIGEGDLPFHVMVVADLTVLRQKEQILEAERMMRSILETTAEAIVVCDAGERVIQANQAARDLSGSDPVGLPFQEAFPLVMDGSTLLLDTITKGAGVRAAAASLSAAAGEVSLLVSAGPLQGAGRVGFVVSLVDVTGHVKTEAQLRTLNETLEQRVTERTVMVQQQGRRLRALASDLARAEQRERKRLGRLLHDHLQQLLVAASLKVGRLRRRGGPREDTEKVDEVEALLQQAIQASRDLTLELSPAILNDAGLGTALRWLARQMRDRYGLDVEIEAPEDVPEALEGLRFFAFSAARELLFNTVKHAGVKQARLILDPRHERGLVRLTVEDDGCGFDESPGRREESGHGMPDIRHRLEMMGGYMTIETAPGKGARVTLLIPVAASAMESFPLKSMPTLVPSEVVVAPRSADAAAQRPRRLRILLVDDHTILRQGLAGLLSHEPDMEAIAEASNGLEALELARLLRPDVIVMDASMPEMSGLEATRHIVERFPDIVVVGLSMYDSEDMSDAMKAAGARAYVSKEKASEELCSVIRNVMRAKRRNRTSPSPTTVTPSRA
ncbi:MAG: response regulator [Candidatus Polarisedimenticolia bacterium]